MEDRFCQHLIASYVDRRGLIFAGGVRFLDSRANVMAPFSIQNHAGGNCDCCRAVIFNIGYYRDESDKEGRYHPSHNWTELSSSLDVQDVFLLLSCTML